jgi:hypothetical protein
MKKILILIKGIILVFTGELFILEIFSIPSGGDVSGRSAITLVLWCLFVFINCIIELLGVDKEDSE